MLTDVSFEHCSEHGVRSWNVSKEKKKDDKAVCLHLFDLMILSQQSVRTVGDTHGDDAHAAYHHHGNIHIGEDCHDSRSYRGKIETMNYFLAVHTVVSSCVPCSTYLWRIRGFPGCRWLWCSGQSCRGISEGWLQEKDEVNKRTT